MKGGYRPKSKLKFLKQYGAEYELFFVNHDGDYKIVKSYNKKVINKVYSVLREKFKHKLVLI